MRDESARATPEQGLGGVMKLIVDGARKLAGADAAVIQSLESGDLVTAAASGAAEVGQRVPVEASLAAACARTGEILHLTDAYADGRVSRALARRLGVRSLVGVPLHDPGGVWGVLVITAARADAFDERTLSTLTLLSGVIATALSRASEYAAREALLSERSDALRTLHDVAIAAAAVSDSATAAKLAVDHAQSLLGVDGAMLYGWDSGRRWLRRVEIAGPPVLPETLESGEGLIGTAFETATAVAVADHLAWENTIPMPFLAGDAGAVAVPVMSRDTPIGALGIWCRPARAFSADEVEVLTLLAAEIAPALEAAKLQAELAASEERFRAVFDRAAIGVARIGLDGAVIEANPSLHRMLGYAQGLLHAIAFGHLTDPEDFDDYDITDLAGSRRERNEVEGRLLCTDGTRLWCKVIASLVRRPSGEPSFVVAMIEDISLRKAQEDALEYQALHDSLTLLPNRMLLNDRLEHALQSSRRLGEPVAFMLMDLDRFKEVNDTFGHFAGDQLLKDVGTRLRGKLRDADTFARLGGDEFAFVLTGIGDTEGAVLTARRLLEAFDLPFVVESEAVEIGASIGIAIAPEHGDGGDILMRRADVAMYVAKRAGGGYEVYTQRSDNNSSSRLALMRELRQAIAGDQLRLHFQPKVDLRRSTVHEVEALVRWQHPEHGLMAPDQFVPLAEVKGLIRPLGIWVLKTAVRQAASWQRDGVDLQVSVNLSTRNLLDPRLPDTVEESLAEHGVDARLLRLEITESALMTEPERALDILTRLNRMGVRISIDDFGTGYSSLGYLRRLPVDEIKIDKSFVTGMAASESDAVIVRSTVELGHNLGLQVVAEGVETAEILGLLRGTPCDLGQGYYLGHPLPADDLAVWVTKH